MFLITNHSKRVEKHSCLFLQPQSLWDTFNCTYPSKSCQSAFSPFSLFGNIKKKSLHTRWDIVPWRTCQCPNFSEYLRSPSTDWTKGLWSGQTARQRLQLLLRAWQGHLPQEHNSHTAGRGEKIKDLILPWGHAECFRKPPPAKKHSSATCLLACFQVFHTHSLFNAVEVAFTTGFYLCFIVPHLSKQIKCLFLGKVSFFCDVLSQNV